MEHQEREERLLRVAKLIRAQGHIRDFRNESLLPAIMDKVQTAYDDAMKLRDILKLVDHMESNKERETHQEMYKRYTLLYMKNHLIEKIEEAIKFLTTQSNVLNSNSGVVTVLEDLDRATLIFRMKMMKYTVDLSGGKKGGKSATSEEKSVVDKTTPGKKSEGKTTTEQSEKNTTPVEDPEEKSTTPDEKSEVNTIPDEESEEKLTRTDENADEKTEENTTLEDAEDKPTTDEKTEVNTTIPDEELEEKLTTDINLDEDSEEKSKAG